jgi:hypothetical protein
MRKTALVDSCLLLWALYAPWLTYLVLDSAWIARGRTERVVRPLMAWIAVVAGMRPWNMIVVVLMSTTFHKKMMD